MAESERPAPPLFAAIWRYRWSSLAYVLLGLLIGAAVGIALPGTPTAKATLSINVRGFDLTRSQSLSPSDENKFVSDRAAYVRSAEVLDAVAAATQHRFTTAQLARMVKTSTSTDNSSVDVTVTAPTRPDAIEVANAVVTAYGTATQAQVARETTPVLATLNSQLAAQQAMVVALSTATTSQRNLALTTLRPAIAALEDEVSTLQTNTAAYGDGLRFTQPAYAATGGVRRPKPIDAAAGLLLGLVVAVGVAWTRADRNAVVSGTELVEHELGAPVLGTVGSVGTAAVDWRTLPIGTYEQVANAVRANVHSGVIGFTAVVDSPDVAVAAAAIGRLAAQDGLHVLLLDGMAGPDGGLTALWGTRGERPGLLEVAADQSLLPQAVTRQDVPGNGLLDLVGLGSAQVQEPSRFRSTGTMRMIEFARESYDLVLVAGSPVRTSPTAAALFTHVDAVIPLVPAGTAADQVAEVRHQLDLLSVLCLGAIFVDGPTPTVPTARRAEREDRAALRSS